MNEAPTAPAAPEPKNGWLEPACAILMGVASLSTAWCSYQNSRWSGQSSDLGTHADKLERQAIAQYVEAQQIESVQVQAFMETVDAHFSGDEKRERFYADRFGAELKPAYEKWIALKPFENPAAPPHPFTPDLYVPRFQQEIRDAQAEAARAQAQSNAEGQTAASYLSNTVLFASVLFFAGTAGKFDQRHVRQSSLAFAIALFLYAAMRMCLLPVA
ncbi:MAG: hypothetical protein K8R23_08995 [Chthoniobacter sp.]|nr:hypothetical protein [Chthoniobacter sp.]